MTDNIIALTIETDFVWSYEWSKCLEYLHRIYGGRWTLVIPSFGKSYAENKEGKQFYLDRTERLYE